MDKLGLWKGRSSTWLRLVAIGIGLLAVCGSTAGEPDRGSALDAARYHHTTDAQVAGEIRAILFRHWRAASTDPAHIAADLTQLANYYARYPAAVTLFRSIDDKPWRLQYQPDRWASRARGNRLDVTSVDVIFDTRSGARLLNHPTCVRSSVCFISPADALLHELLHVQTMLFDAQHFIEVGSGGALYAERHETQVIGKENLLYQAMAAVDQRPRPQRRGHAGRLLPVACPLCLPYEPLSDPN